MFIKNSFTLLKDLSIVIKKNTNENFVSLKHLNDLKELVLQNEVNFVDDFFSNLGVSQLVARLKTGEHIIIERNLNPDSEIDFSLILLNDNYFNRQQGLKLISAVNEFSKSIETQKKDEKIQFLINEISKIAGFSLGHAFKVTSDIDEVLKPTNIWFTENEIESSLFKEKTQNFFIKSGLDIPGKALKKQSIKWFTALKYSNYYSRLNKSSGNPFSSAVSFPIKINENTRYIVELYHREEVYPYQDIIHLIEVFASTTGSSFEKEAINEFKKEKDLALNQASFRGEFLAKMSHEIRTPLNGVIGVIDFLKNQKNLNPEFKDLISTIDKSSNDLLSIINDVLQLSKLEAGEIKLVNTVFDIKDTVEHCCSLFEKSMDQKGLEFSILFESLGSQLYASDNTKIGQILKNLISNAYKYSEKGKVQVKTTLTKKGDTHNTLVVSVSDNGYGMSPEQVETVFDKYTRFNTYSSDKQIKGTGLGLNIAYQMAKTLGGSLECESELGVGTTFTLSLNLLKAEPLKTDEKKEKEIPENSLNVLVVEDNKVNQKVAGLILNKYCRNIDFADNGQDMFDRFEENLFDYDIVFMDINMPIMDGIQATNKMILELDLCPPIVGLSANAMEGDKEKYLAIGMDDYISKPVTKNKIEEVLKNYI